MVIKIKKWSIFGTLGLVALACGLFLLIALFEGLRLYGLKGYIIFIIFCVCSISYLMYNRYLKEQYTIAEKAAEITAASNDEKLDPDRLSLFKKELTEHLKKKVYEEDYTIGKK